MSNNLTVKILEVSGLEIAAQYVGLPVGNIRSRDAVLTSSGVLTRESLRRLGRLIAKGDEHAKIMRQVIVHMEITGPIYWWTQFATYEIGREMYSGSTMHTLLKDPPDFDNFVSGTAFSPGLADALGAQDLVRAKANLPEGFLQTRLIMVSYQTLRRMWLQRRKHRLPEWHEFIEALHELPYCHDLILVEPYNPYRELWIGLLDDAGILDDARPDTLNIVGLSSAQCDEYTSAVLGLLHKEGAQATATSARVVTDPNHWRGLWFSVHGEPHTWSSGSNLGQGRHCFFCDHPYPGHTQDCLYLRAVSTSILFSSDDDWHTLWQKLMELGPWDKTGFCHYCGVPAPGVHDPKCPYLRAIVLEGEITKEGK